MSRGRGVVGLSFGAVTLAVPLSALLVALATPGPADAAAKPAAPKAKALTPGAKGKPAKPKGDRKPGARKRKRRGRPEAEFFGIQSWGALSSGELRAVRAGGIGIQKIFLGWPYIETEPGARHWTYADHQIAAAAAHGIEVLPVLFGTPAHLGSSYTQPPPPSPGASAALASFAADAVRRYGPGGAFWQLNPALPYHPITRWQLWNEPSSAWYWDGSPDGAEYAVLVRDAGGAIKSVDPDANVILAGLLPNTDDPNGIPARHFLHQLYSVRGIRRYFDDVALNPYTVRPRRVIEISEQVRRLLRKRDRKAGLWITELGWATGGSGNPRLVVDQASQARKLTRTYRELIERRRALRLRGIVWHILRDRPNPNWDHWAMHTGLFDSGKSPKPAWPALTRITGGRAVGIDDPPDAPPPPEPPKQEQCFLLIFC